ncbi:hypothetical protein LXA43DRAFT_1084020 [Ganoderma leucocontextum]|nr:hypothetical protein LXA43DRAFT_1084020 [Ganoderma leucocontextum]
MSLKQLLQTSVATKLTGGRRARKAAPIQEVEDNVDVVPTTDPDPATVPQPPAPPRKRGGKAVKKDENEPQIASSNAVASSSHAVPIPPPAPTKRTIKRTKSTQSKASNRKVKAPEPPIEDVQAPQLTVDPVPITPASPKSPKPIEDIERITTDLRTLNATLLADDQIQMVEQEYDSYVYENAALKYLNTPKEAVRLVRQAYVQHQSSTRDHANDSNQITVRVSARDQREEHRNPQPSAASTSQAVVPSNPGPKRATLKREGAVNLGYPEYYKERLRKAQQAGDSAPANLDHPDDDQSESEDDERPVTSSSSTVPSASTNLPTTSSGAAPSRNGNAAASDAPRPPARLQRWNAVVLGYPEGYTPRTPWPASVIDPTGLTTHPDVFREPSGTLVVPPHLLPGSVTLSGTRNAPPQSPAAAASQSATAAAFQTPAATASQTPATAALHSHSPPPSSSSNESADLAEVEASISFDLDNGDAHPAAHLLDPNPEPTANRPATAAPPRAVLTRQHASFFDKQGREIPAHHDDDDAVVQQVLAHVMREVEEERAARPLPSGSRVQITRTDAPPAPRPTASIFRPARAERPPGPKPTSIFGGAPPSPLARPSGSSGMSLFAPAGNGKGKGKANAGANAQAKGKAVAKNGRVSNGRVEPSLDKGKKRAREPELQLWGYASSTGPMKVRVSLVPVVPSPKRQRVSETDGDDAGPAGPAAVAVLDELESTPAPSEEQAATQHGGAKRSRAVFEEGSSRTDTDLEGEGEGETRPVKKLRTRSQ